LAAVSNFTHSDPLTKTNLLSIAAVEAALQEGFQRGLRRRSDQRI